MKFLRKLTVRKRLILAMGLSILIFVLISTALSVILTGDNLKERAVNQELPAAVGEIRNDILRQIGGPLALTQGMAGNTMLLDWEEKGLSDDGMAAWQKYAQRLKADAKAASTPVKDARLLVSITKEERVLFGEEDVTSHVDEALKDSARVQKERELYIRADKDARYEIVAKVVAAARNSGVESLNLLVEPVVEDAPEGPAGAASGTAKAAGKAGGK